MFISLIAAIAFALPSGIVAAASVAQPIHHHAAPVTSANPSLDRVNAEMHAAMGAVPLTGNPDRDFIASMIPHHQGAVEMAKVVLAEGKDPEVRKLALDIIKAQKREIDWMHKKLRSLEVSAPVSTPAKHH